jgi:ribosomal protein S18 acetylase RimI-like enzyme
VAADVADDDACVLAGTIDETVIGYAVGRTETLRDGSTLGVITDLYVDEGARAVGVGEAMMGSLLEWFRARGCAGVDATALPGNRATKNFFEESGFTARLLVMHHRLP